MYFIQDVTYFSGDILIGVGYTDGNFSILIFFQLLQLELDMKNTCRDRFEIFFAWNCNILSEERVL